ncbi:hypothetical protein [Polaribacter cellanae]|uniref:Uncharacterized protein n=1 Tax=Polaribacter cellanae TaxID=2818493 RepID=A0A975CL55_9FLAO|nr:hypothetical protein [Polaribacter cellanae]QTE21708.1 hypothetical protein J3359_12870 [Polaribacter cellanae]
MNIQSEKYHLIQQIIELQNTTVIKKIREVLSGKTSNNDWHHELSSAEKKSISKGLQDLENGNILSHKEVINAVKSKIASLKTYSKNISIQI